MRKQGSETGRKAGFLQTGIMMFIGAVIGGGGSILFFCLGNYIKSDLESMALFIYRCSSSALILVSLFSFLISSFFVLRARKKYEKWDENNEEIAEKIERSYGFYQSFLSFLSVVGICLSGIVISEMYRIYNMNNNVALLFFATSTLWILFAMDRILKYIKKINPERKGNVFSWNYDKEWLASCDEREKMQVFRAGYAVYLKSNYLYLIIFIGLILFSVIFDLGITPFIILLIMWCSQSLLFMYYKEKDRIKGEK